MNYIKKAVTTLGGIFLGALLIAALAPKATHAVVAAFVEITNTSSNPVPNRDVDDRDRATIEFVSCNAFTHSGGNGAFSCAPSYTVPAGQRLVIDQLDGTCVTNAGEAVTFGGLSLTMGGTLATAYFDIGSPLANFGGEYYSWNEPVHYIADPGSTFFFSAVESDATGATHCTFDLSGHLVSYP